MLNSSSSFFILFDSVTNVLAVSLSFQKSASSIIFSISATLCSFSSIFNEVLNSDICLFTSSNSFLSSISSKFVYLTVFRLILYKNFSEYTRKLRIKTIFTYIIKSVQKIRLLNLTFQTLINCYFFSTPPAFLRFSST